MEVALNKYHPLSKVVEGDYCVGCGACAFVSKKSMEINEYGEYVPEKNVFSLDANNYKETEFVCPSLNPDYNEDVLAKQFLVDCENPSDSIGVYQSVLGGSVIEGNFRDRGTSGGFGSWIGTELLRNGLIDGVIHVKESDRSHPSDPFFKYALSESEEQIREGSKTKYHVVEISEILNLVKDKPGKYLFMGLPCMVKAVRRIQIIDPEIAQSIKYTAALVCGHLKSVNWTLSLAWGKGVVPANMEKILYRTKAENISARAYVFTAYFNNGHGLQQIMEDSGNVVGGKFNQGALMLPACNFCDDLVGETADITIGDAWLPKYEIDSQGTNLLILRNSEISNILNRAQEENRISLDVLTEKDAIYAQSGGFRQRKEGLSYRLKATDRKKIWRPEKRISATQYNPPFLRRLIYKMRSRVTEKSRKVFQTSLETNNYSLYKSTMQVQLKVLRFCEILSSVVRIIDKKFMYFKLRRQKK